MSSLALRRRRPSATSSSPCRWTRFCPRPRTPGAHPAPRSTRLWSSCRRGSFRRWWSWSGPASQSRRTSPTSVPLGGSTTRCGSRALPCQRWSSRATSCRSTPRFGTASCKRFARKVWTPRPRIASSACSRTRACCPGATPKTLTASSGRSASRRISWWRRTAPWASSGAPSAGRHTTRLPCGSPRRPTASPVARPAKACCGPTSFSSVRGCPISSWRITPQT
mmetsp:Transcript_20220/g.55796  ORF Transcript_20220/g.55796 Transcript_20220/m.55796 type:complete len:223 (+) Transcript_20220:1465-2133(+)